jgi:hypothetical protein
VVLLHLHVAAMGVLPEGHLLTKATLMEGSITSAAAANITNLVGLTGSTMVLQANSMEAEVEVTVEATTTTASNEVAEVVAVEEEDTVAEEAKAILPGITMDMGDTR